MDTTPATVDRFSTLPDEIAHRILRLLALHELAPLKLASKRCNQLCFTIPYLFFSNRTHMPKDSDDGIQRIKYLDALVDQRQAHGIKTIHFWLNWSFEGSLPDEEVYINKWLPKIVASGVKTLKLDVIPRSGSTFQLPASLFRCETLTCLLLHLNKRVAKFPLVSSFQLHGLQILKLEYVHIEDKMLKNLVSQSCQCLKELQLLHCTGLHHLSISSSSLKLFRLYYLDSGNLLKIEIHAENLNTLSLTWFPIRSENDSTSLTIFTPKLNRFHWTGYPVNHYYCRRKLKLLEVSELHFLGFPGYPDRPWSEVSKCNVPDLICSLENMRILQIHLQTIEVVFFDWGFPVVFDHLEKLTLFASDLRDSRIRRLSCVLNGMPNLKVLEITYNDARDFNTNRKVGTEFNEGFWELQALDLVDNLEELSIELFEGQNGLELLKFLLKNSKKLKTVRVYHSPTFPHDVGAAIKGYQKPFTRLRILRRARMGS